MPTTFIIVPAAGGGQRMQHATPKQYLDLAGTPILERTLNTLLAVPDIAQVVVALALDDTHFKHLTCSNHPRLQHVIGGASRAASVLNALNHLVSVAQPQDWVLVHDAARPLVHLADIAHLRLSLHDHPVGGILAAPVTDTLKHVHSDTQISHTLDRSTLWRALTPQLCRFGLLKQALEHGLAQRLDLTDEAMALETLGHYPTIVAGSPDNIKITYPIDLQLAALLIGQSHVK